MTRNPDQDLDAQKLELTLRESNVQMADGALEQADRHLLDAHDALAQVPSPNDTVSRVLYAQSHGALAAAGYQQVLAKMHLEAERAQVSHLRAHLDHLDGEREQMETVERIRTDGMNAMIEQLREAGFDPQTIPGMGLVIRPPEDDRPNS